MDAKLAKKYIGCAYRCDLDKRSRAYIYSDVLRDYVQRAAEWLTSDTYPCLLLCGQPGNGKTTLMNALRMVINICELENAYGEKVLCRTTNAKEIASLAKQNSKQYAELSNRSILAIDDMGTEPAEVVDYGNILCPVTDLIANRYENQLMTIITTNLTPKQIREKYGDRIADRLNEFAQKIIFDLPSYRGRNARIPQESAETASNGVY